mmetsp:Transcript_89857/g.279647  ORF Transcript_89857/g.279647 Transcript_89857/m.279647 type:complete len:261 (+) Transcript_89857:239-1021(+)
MGTSGSDAVRRLLDLGLVARKQRLQLHVQRERDVDQAHDDHDGNAHQLGLPHIALVHEDRHDLLPAEGRVDHEDEGGEDVEASPDGVLEDLELQRVDIADPSLGDGHVVRPEEVQSQDAPEVDEEGRRADVVGAELLGVAEAELEEVDGHEGHQHEARESKVQHGHPRALHELELHVPRALQPNHDVHQDAEDQVLLHEVGGQPEAGPIQTHVEVTVAIEVVGALEDVEVADGVDDDEDQEEDRAPRQADAVAGDLDVGR